MTDTETPTNVENPVIDQEDITGDGGVLKKILVEGTGDLKPTKGSDVTVHYVGTLTDGTKFDSSRDRDDPFEFPIGEGRVIKGWDKGVATMKKGEKAVFTIRSDYGYGDAGSPPKIPAKATLVFEVELLSWSSEKDITAERNGGIMKTLLEEGEGYESPKDDEKVRVKIQGSLDDGTTFIQHEGLEVVLGEERLPVGVEKAICSMKSGEKATFKIRSDYGYGPKGNSDLNIPPNATLHYEITLVSWDPEKPNWELSAPERFEKSNQRKLLGNEFFKQNKFDLALKKYQKALTYVNVEVDFKTDEDKAKSKEHKIPILLNMAQVNMKQKNYSDAVGNCEKVLDLDKNNIKAVYRRGQAWMALSEFDKANDDLVRAKELDPQNKEILTTLAALKKKIKEQQEKDKKLYSSMFSAIGK